MKTLELTAEANAAFVAAQAILDQIARDRQALQAHYEAESERLKLEGEELERDVKERAGKLLAAQQETMMQKVQAEGLLAGLARLN